MLNPHGLLWIGSASSQQALSSRATLDLHTQYAHIPGAFTQPCPAHIDPCPGYTVKAPLQQAYLHTLLSAHTLFTAAAAARSWPAGGLV